MGKLVNGVCATDRKPRGFERGREGMTNWRQPPGHAKRAESENDDSSSRYVWGAPGSLSMGSNLTFRAWLPKLVIPEPPEPPSLLPSFSFGQETGGEGS